MPQIDFTEIPLASGGSGAQDTFELFAEELLKVIGYRIVQGPGRGPDGGRDLIVEETRKGIDGCTTVRLMVSCKHFAHSQRAVGTEDETNITDRMRAAKASGFIGFYSTLPSSALITRLNELREGTANFDCLVYNRERIEKAILEGLHGLAIARRYLPLSFARWSRDNPPRPNLLMADDKPICCVRCGVDLATPDNGRLGNVVYWHDNSNVIKHMYTVCKGSCDNAYKLRFDRQGLIDSHDELELFLNPTLFIVQVGKLLSRCHYKQYADDVVDELKRLMGRAFHYVSRDLTSEEKAAVELRIEIGYF
jgi:Restriction endonuclease